MLLPRRCRMLPRCVKLAAFALLASPLWLNAAVRADPGPADYALLDPARHAAPVLHPPAAGAEVTALQNALAGVCFPPVAGAPPSGVFDNATDASVRGFQRHANLTADGAVGPHTMEAFDVALGIAAAPTAGLQRITDAQVTPAIAAGAEAVLHAHGSEDVGTEVPFSADGLPWVGRVELHFHPFNGSITPHGYHHGISVYCFSNSSCTGPGRPNVTGSDFLVATAGMSRAAREEQILAQLLRGNVPSFLHGPDAWVTVTATATRDDDAATDSTGSSSNDNDNSSSNNSTTVEFRVLPDYLAIGTDADFVRIPMAAFTAQRVADARGNASLPTTKMVNQIWHAAAAKVAPHPLPPGANMTSNAYFAAEQAAIEAELAALGPPAPPRSGLVGGDKKDIVVSNGYEAHPGSVCIYGWHELDGQPIQPLFCGHADWYADYSHGVRLVHSTVVVDGVPMSLANLLRDPELAALLSDEGPIPHPRIPIPANGSGTSTSRDNSGGGGGGGT